MVYWYYGTTREGNKNDAVSIRGRLHRSRENGKQELRDGGGSDRCRPCEGGGWKIFEGLKEDYGYDKALGKLYSASGICKCIAEFNEPVAQMSKA